MSHKREPRWSIRFELDPLNPDHARLHEYLKSLATSDSASDWMRDNLIRSLPNEGTADLVGGKSNLASTPRLHELMAASDVSEKTVKSTKKSRIEVKTLKPLPLNPAEVLRQRKADAAKKHVVPKDKRDDN